MFFYVDKFEDFLLTGDGSGKPCRVVFTAEEPVQLLLWFSDEELVGVDLTLEQRFNRGLFINFVLLDVADRP